MDIDEEEEEEEEAPRRPVQVTPQMQRRGSMSAEEERQRRASIKAILANTTIPDVERRRSIQHLMDGRRVSMDGRARTPPPQRHSAYDESEEYNGHGSMSQGLSSLPVASADLLNGSFLNASMNDFTAQPLANEQTKRAELTRPVCSHYDRKCTIVSPCCGTAFGCRICHDDCPVLPPKTSVQQARRRYPRSSSMPSSFTNMNAMPEDTHHTIDRFAIAEVICRECFTRQSSKT